MAGLARLEQGDTVRNCYIKSSVFASPSTNGTPLASDFVWKRGRLPQNNLRHLGMHVRTEVVFPAEASCDVFSGAFLCQFCGECSCQESLCSARELYLTTGRHGSLRV
jgi:hypothetical protein